MFVREDIQVCYGLLRYVGCLEVQRPTREQPVLGSGLSTQAEDGADAQNQQVAEVPRRPSSALVGLWVVFGELPGKNPWDCPLGTVVLQNL